MVYPSRTPLPGQSVPDYHSPPEVRIFLGLATGMRRVLAKFPTMRQETPDAFLHLATGHHTRTECRRSARDGRYRVFNNAKMRTIVT
jgi:hypothetical protein